MIDLKLKFKAKNDQIINEKLCVGNLSSEWTTSESENLDYTEIFTILL